MLRKHTDPTLPKAPVLYLDKKNSRARVLVKAIDYRATQAGRVLTDLLGIGLLACFGFVLMQNPPSDSSVAEHLGVYLGMGAILFALFIGVMILVVKPKVVSMLARKVSVKFRPEKIVVGGKTHRRQHQGEPVSYTFQLVQDPDAQKKLAASPKLSDRQRHLLSTSRRIVIVAQSDPVAGMLGGGSMLGSGVAHPVATMLDEEKAIEVLSVLNAAADATTQHAFDLGFEEPLL